MSVPLLVGVFKIFWTWHSVASDLGLHCLPRPVCPNTKGSYGIAYQLTPRFANNFQNFVRRKLVRLTLKWSKGSDTTITWL